MASVGRVVPILGTTRRIGTQGFGSVAWRVVPILGTTRRGVHSDRFGLDHFGRKTQDGSSLLVGLTRRVGTHSASLGLSHGGSSLTRTARRGCL
jgi:hypothetical protein